jgi:trans-2,3-dihydro-3-hydroxyanthranilate isomerase
MKFYIVDVFAEQKYQGNQLAVLVPDCELSTDQMQKIAREINFSETSFIMSKKLENGGYAVRIFTPDIEIPFAGHPTLGTAFVINKIIEGHGDKNVVLNLEVGQIPVSINGDEFTMTQNKPTFGMIIEHPEIVADVLKINAEDIRTDYPIQLVSTGLPCIIVPLKTIDAVKKCSINHDRFRDFIEKYYKCNLLVFTQASESEKCDLRVRVFMDDPGFFEDPATGSANGNLAGYLLKYNFFNNNRINLMVNQGEEINRPSLINILAEKIDDNYHINIGGKCILVAEGEWKI